MQPISKIAQPFPRDICNLLFWRTLGMPGMPDQTQQILHDLTKASIDIYLHAKNAHFFYLK